MVDPAKLRAYLATAPAPTSSCCTAAASFNNAYCSCSDSVLELVKSFTNNDIEAYSEVAQYLSNRCKEVGTDFTLYYKDTCPAQKP
ncbi:hypothetical protein HYH03_007942 [Edaphochlamys debaryana]|uniref:Uncharacterized protein n=1 Tax=Edaphochlamys debaryana TaxID=47281 RepID=A0A835Y4J5_9CHLO|nr:hypothetical protein HYH03_007942 [Edaphochlamys debaryana]|eukprot:KAG2494016.1 hypothetical protein HYH03_007942 [Edaphochlamys debaryana]